MIDHSLLKPNSTLEDLKKVCQEAIEYKFKTVCINPIFVGEAASLPEERMSLSALSWSFLSDRFPADKGL